MPTASSPSSARAGGIAAASQARCAAVLRKIWAKADALLLNAATVPYANHMVFAQRDDGGGGPQRSTMSPDAAMTQGNGSRIFPGGAPSAGRLQAGGTSVLEAPPGASYAALVDACVADCRACDASVGSLVGLALGDAFGAPLEFLPAIEDMVVDVDAHRTATPATPVRPHLRRLLRQGTNGSVSLLYVGEENKFRLERGQWTDDASMALCLADSLIVSARPCADSTPNIRYDDGDCRMRYSNWWFHGYNNCFRHDTRRPDRTSVGLGGNIAVSLYDVQALLMGTTDAASPRSRKGPRLETGTPNRAPPPPLFLTAVEIGAHPFMPSSKDSGNGSLMRLAPIPIRFHRDVHAAMRNAESSSYSTHAGDEAAVACTFVAFFVATAIGRWRSASETSRAMAGLSLRDFLDEVVRLYSADVRRRGGDQDPAMVRLLALLQASPPSNREACWNWKAPQLHLEITFHARGGRYQGYPVSRGYFGSYALDGLAIALWAMHGSGGPDGGASSFTDVLLRVVNVLGDADSTGAIACQMAGAFFGYRALTTETPLSQAMVRHVAAWDPDHEIAMRAVLLHHLAVCEDTSSAEGGQVAGGV